MGKRILLRMNERVIERVRHYARENKPIAAIRAAGKREGSARRGAPARYARAS